MRASNARLLGVFLDECVQSVPLVRSMSQLVTDLDQSGQSLLVVRGEQVMLKGRPEEGSDVVPILLDRVFSVLQVMVPMPFQLVHENAELLVIGIFFHRGPSFEAVDDETETDLCVLHADRYILLEELRKGLSAQVLPLLVQSLHQFINLGVVQSQEIAIGGVEEPILRSMFGLDCNQQHPVVGNREHEAYHQGLLLVMCPELLDETIQLSLFLLGEQQVLILELPRERKELKSIVIPEYGEIRCMFQADPIVCPLEISMEDILLPPRPLLSQFVLLLHFKEKAFDAAFEPPEGSPTLHVIGSIALQEREETESVEGCVIPTEVSSSLLVDAGVMDLVIGKVSVRNEFSEWLWRDGRGCPADIRESFFEDVVPEVADLLGHDGYLDSTHFDYIDDFGLGGVKDALRSEIVGRNSGLKEGLWRWYGRITHVCYAFGTYAIQSYNIITKRTFQRGAATFSYPP